ncbi:MULTISPECIES: very short patch repair endonuclease [Pseudomonas]|uniref:very short patch repair endonuclease n=1 Tax=Pseudomonas TaxID=286 RepID=UPI000BB95943|nr:MULTISPECIES: DNA mismatch endonuclease Vsr [Pseudomonas]PBQ22068.1 very short patch repair endonuclease [Pseudomonas congelans]POP73626.1 very short patch repair endonuclease [Pseudomonas syringae pv. syringae]
MCADVFTPEQRSKVMAKIKGKNTKPEMIVRSTCHRMGLRFRLHRVDLPGKPDLVFTKRKLCLFVHGCFWHQHSGCKYAYQPKSRPEFWIPKLQKNIIRDENAKDSLEALGWKVAVIWECQTKKIDEVESIIKEIIE